MKPVMRKALAWAMAVSMAAMIPLTAFASEEKCGSCSVFDPTLYETAMKSPQKKKGRFPAHVRTVDTQKNIKYSRSETKKGIVTISVEKDEAVLYGTIEELRFLKENGIKEIVFKTNKQESSFKLKNAIEKGYDYQAYTLSHKNDKETFRIANKKVEKVLNESKDEK